MNLISTLSADTKAPTDSLNVTLALAESGVLTTSLSAKQLRDIERRLGESIATAEAILDGTRGHAGTAAILHFGIGLGTGYLRHCRDIIRALLKARKTKTP